MVENIIWRLRIGTRLTGFTVEPDEKWSGMWRIHAPNGRASDMVNLARAKDSALLLARRKFAADHGSADFPIYWERSASSVAVGA